MSTERCKILRPDLTAVPRGTARPNSPAEDARVVPPVSGAFSFPRSSLVHRRGPSISSVACLPYGINPRALLQVAIRNIHR